MISIWKVNDNEGQGFHTIEHCMKMKNIIRPSFTSLIRKYFMRWASSEALERLYFLFTTQENNVLQHTFLFLPTQSLKITAYVLTKW
jgi:hypothetical protein